MSMGSSSLWLAHSLTRSLSKSSLFRLDRSPTPSSPADLPLPRTLSGDEGPLHHTDAMIVPPPVHHSDVLINILGSTVAPGSNPVLSSPCHCFLGVRHCHSCTPNCY
ncbi:hypothetical protein ACLOJK_001475 [Asimina triloba]